MNRPSASLTYWPVLIVLTGYSGSSTVTPARPAGECVPAGGEAEIQVVEAMPLP